jgi:large subunit ribosomal protein L22
MFSDFDAHYTKPLGTENWHEKRAMPGSGGHKYRWPTFNDRIHPPILECEDGPEPRQLRPAYICHMRPLIRYSPQKMWYIASMARGLTIDEAIKQMSFVYLKGAIPAREVLEEARQLAVAEHNVEFASNLWVAESFCTIGDTVKSVRKHARSKIGLIQHFYTNYYVRLEEGKPPKDYYEWKATKSPHEWLEDYVNKHREKTIPFH